MFLFGLIPSQNMGIVICLSPLNILKKRMFPHRPLVFTHEEHQGTGKGTGRRVTASLLGLWGLRRLSCLQTLREHLVHTRPLTPGHCAASSRVSLFSRFSA